jgi:membrane protein implicated in regulation of membrane protease activity
MRFIQFIFSFIFLLWLLSVAWPLFLVMAIVLVVSWVRFIRKVKVIQKNAFDSEPIQRPTVGSGDIIDAEYTESEVEED